MSELTARRVDELESCNVYACHHRSVVLLDFGGMSVRFCRDHARAAIAAIREALR